MDRRALRIVTRPREGLGFRLAGATVEELGEREAASRLAALLDDPAVAVIAIDEELLARAPTALLERVRLAGVPVVIPVSLPRRLGEASRAEDYVIALIRRAIGYHVKISREGRE